MKSLSLYIEENRYKIVEAAINQGIELAGELNISTESRVRRKKLMPGETAQDAALTLKEKLKNDMLECLDRFNSELATRSKASNDVASLYEVVQPNLLRSGNQDDLKRAVQKLSDFYDEISGPELYLEIFRFRRHLQASKLNSTEWMSLQILEFIVEWDFIDSVPNLVSALKLFLTVCVSVATCERSFSKLKLIKNFLRSTMEADRLNSLAILSIEHTETQKINFDEVLSNFAEAKARKVKF